MTVNPFEGSKITLVIEGTLGVAYVDVDPSLYTVGGKGSATFNISNMNDIIELHKKGDLLSVNVWVTFGKSVPYSADLVDVTCSYTYINSLYVKPVVLFIKGGLDNDTLLGTCGANESALYGKYSYYAPMTTDDIVSGLQMKFGLDTYNEQFVDAFENGYIALELNTYSQGLDSASYNSGYADGKEYGYKNGYDVGYEFGYEKGEKHGYNLGYLDQPEGGFENLFFALFDAQARVFQSVLNFEIFGINIASFLMTILSLVIIAFVVKKVV